jgi:hypothetical protein
MEAAPKRGQQQEVQGLGCQAAGASHPIVAAAEDTRVGGRVTVPVPFVALIPFVPWLWPVDYEWNSRVEGPG